MYNPPRLSLDVLEDARKFAVAVLPQLLKIIYEMSQVSPAVYYDVRQTIEDILGEDAVDGRLLTQYALNVAFSNKVGFFSYINKGHLTW